MHIYRNGRIVGPEIVFCCFYCLIKFTEMQSTGNCPEGKGANVGIAASVYMTGRRILRSNCAERETGTGKRGFLANFLGKSKTRAAA
jgi:hypothetical protein